jgi:hypothetical protein
LQPAGGQQQQQLKKMRANEALMRMPHVDQRYGNGRIRGGGGGGSDVEESVVDLDAPFNPSRHHHRHFDDLLDLDVGKQQHFGRCLSTRRFHF